jgi:uncharacterized protein (DUF4415 family)
MASLDSSTYEKRHHESGGLMRKEYDFSKGKRGAMVQNKGKTRITIFLDDAVLNQFRALSQSTGKGYQTLINEALNAHLGLGGETMTPDLV